VGPQAPGQPAGMELTYDNFNLVKNKPEAIKQHSGHLRFPLQQACAPTLRPTGLGVWSVTGKRDLWGGREGR